MTAVDVSFGTDYIQTPATTAVDVAAAWADGWTSKPNLYVRSLRKGIGAQVDHAVIEELTGKIENADVAEDALLRQFVRVTYASHRPAQTNYWYGVIVSKQEEQLGLADLVTAKNNQLSAFGLEWLFTRVPIDSAVYHVPSSSPVRIGRPIAFNSGGSRNKYSTESPGNKHTGQSNFVHPEHVSTAEPWTAFSAVEYLLANFAVATGLTFQLAADSDDYLDWFIPRNANVGPTLFDALNQIISPSRGITWSLVADAGDDSIHYVTVYSYAVSNVVVDSTTLTANPVQKSFETDEYQHIGVIANTDTSRHFEQVKVYGARRGACFTVGNQDGTLDAGWSSAQQTAYVDAASLVTPLADRKALADMYRAGDLLEHVFSRFIVPFDWSGKVGDGTGAIASGSFNPACPSLDGSGDPTSTISPQWIPGLRVLPWVPMREQLDYQYSTDTPTGTIADQTSQYRRPFICYKSGSKYIRGDKAAHLGRNEKYGNGGISFSAAVAPLTDAFGVEIRTTGPNHMHASTVSLVSDHKPEVDWQEAVITLMAEFDERTQAVYPASPASAQNGQQAILTIDVGDAARLDYIAPNTVTGVDDDGTLKKNTVGGFVRDDRGILLRIAQVSYEWYSTPRLALTVQMAQIGAMFDIGDLITSLNEVAVATLVTHITYDFDRQSTTINTDYGEIDPVGMMVTPQGGVI